MDIVKIRSNEVREWIKFIPLDILSGRNPGQVMMLGAQFLDQNAGAIVWSEDTDKANILSIFVDSGARRMGVGSALMRAMKDEILKKKIFLVEFEYSEEMEKALLTPFFKRFGGQIHENSFPLGLRTLKEVCRVLMLQKITPKEECSFSELSLQDKNVLHSFILEKTGMDPGVYLTSTPGYVVFDGEKPCGVMLMRDNYSEEMIYVDYLWAKNNPRALARIISAAFKYCLNLPGKESRLVHFILATEESKKLYESFFGPVERSVGLCKGYMDLRVIDSF